MPRNMEQLPSPSYFARLPHEVTCMALNRLTAADLLRLYPTPQWRPIFDRCLNLGAGTRDIVYVALNDLLTWTWTRNITYVLTDFPLEGGRWPLLLGLLENQPVLAIRLTYNYAQSKDAFRRLGDMAHPPPNGRRIVLHEDGRGLEYSVADIFAGEEYLVRYYHGLRRTTLTRNGEIVSLEPGRVLSRLGYDFFLTDSDIGLVDPTRPPGPDNKPLRDVLTMAWTYVVARPRELYSIVIYHARAQQRRGLEGSWIWLAPYFERMRHYRAAKDVHEEDRLYLEKFGVTPTRRVLLEMGAGYRSTAEKGLPSDLFFEGAGTILNAFAAEVPHPIDGKEFTGSVEADADYIDQALSAYASSPLIYLVNGEAIDNTNEEERNSLTIWF